MILSAIMYGLAQLISGFGSYLPTGSLPAGVASSVQSVVSWIWVADPVFDVETLFSLLSLYFILELTIQGIQFFFWAVGKLPFIGK